ncbi:hypothetical protein DFH29DRAFT_818403 [Suillus ampliporus]|nr:hypothetical protein DFH29DRAFT_818403 [Suillus ampliporus]
MLLASIQGLPCNECTDLTVHVDHLIEIAQDLKPHTNYQFLGLAHLQDLARSYAEQVKKLKLQASNKSYKYMTALMQLDNHNCFVMAISEGDIPHIQ